MAELYLVQPLEKPPKNYHSLFKMEWKNKSTVSCPRGFPLDDPTKYYLQKGWLRLVPPGKQRVIHVNFKRGFYFKSIDKLVLTSEGKEILEESS